MSVVTSFMEFATARVEALSPGEWAAFSVHTAVQVDVFRSALAEARRLLVDLARIGVVERQLAGQREAMQREVYQRAAVESARVLSLVLAEFGLNPAEAWVRESVARQWRALPADG